MTDIRSELLFERPRIAVDHAGDGELLVFLHGIGGNRRNWRRQIEALSATYHTLAWDARGYGDSDDYDGPLEFGTFAADLVRVLDHFGVEKAHLCGLSMGGRIAQDFYARHPGRVATLILVSAVSGYDRYTPEQLERFLALRKRPLVEEGKEPVDIAPDVAKSLIGPGATPEQFDELVASIAALHKDSYVKTLEASVRFSRTDALEAIAVPTMLVYGGGDSLTTPEIGRTMAAQIPGARFALIERAGHLVNIEQPDRFNRIVRDFLDHQSGRADAPRTLKGAVS